MNLFRKMAAVLLVLTMVLSMLVLNVQAATTNKNQTLQIKAQCCYEDAFDVLSQLNALRKSKGLKELKMNKVFLDNAMQRAAELALMSADADMDGFVTVMDATEIQLIKAGKK